MQPIINRQISDLKESATLFINQLALKLRSEGQNICHLGFGESPFPVPEPMQAALRENARRKNLQPTVAIRIRIARIATVGCRFL